MANWLENEVYAKDRTLAAHALARALFRGELALCLGSGVSRPLGLPPWHKLVKNCLELAGLPHDEIHDQSDIATLKRKAGDVRRAVADDKEFHELVSNCLYSERRERTPENATALLTALGALMMGSRRGRIKEVWTLNFDDVIEWYLRINGFVTQVVTEVPCLLGDVDVTVFHPHGFLPLDEQSGRRSRRIVFDDTSYAEHAFGTDKGMIQATQNIIGSKIILGIGLAWSEDTLQNLLKAASVTTKNRPLAFWLFGPGDSAENTKRLSSDKENCLAHNVVPVQFEDFSEYPAWLLSICEKAMVGVSSFR